MPTPQPNPPPTKVAIGLPVRNGQNYLEQAIESVLGQTFTDLTLIISDNASDDGTAEICRRFADKDPRVVYYRQKENIGAAPNFNFVFKMSRSPYFRWAAHDDVVGPDFLRGCVEMLDANASLAVAHPMAAEIDKDGRIRRTFDSDGLPGGLSPSQRLRWVLWVPEFTEIYGLIRSDMLRRTRLMGSFGGADRNLLGEILLQGDIGRAPACQFFRRDHPGTLSRTLAPGRHSATAERSWYDPRARLPVFMVWPVRLRRHLSAALGAPIPGSEKLACVGALVERGLRRAVQRLTRGAVFGGRPAIGNQLKTPASYTGAPPVAADPRAHPAAGPWSPVRLPDSPE